MCEQIIHLYLMVLYHKREIVVNANLEDKRGTGVIERNCELLLDYLNNILYDSKVQPLDIECLDEPFRKLGMGLLALQEAVEEMQEYSLDLSRGNLSRAYPSEENFLCHNLKQMHENLSHLVWQAKQVAIGDYSQHVSCLGEFSDAFNTMTDQLKEREMLLKAEKERAQRRLARKAYHDPGTGIYNRLYFDEYMAEILREGHDFTLAYMDLDGLKTVNDQFGHNEGDGYINAFVSTIKSLFRSTDVFARIGGDEFCIVIEGCQGEMVKEKLTRARMLLADVHNREYLADFSFGLVEIKGLENELPLEKIVTLADTEMYRCKRKNKKRKSKT